MEDFNFWWYIIAAVIYFLTRSKKKKPQPSRPGTEDNPTPSQRPKSFEELLREITEGRLEQEEPAPQQKPVVVKAAEPVRRETEEDAIRMEGQRRMFSDQESKRIYEESVKMAEGADLKFAPAEQYTGSRLFKSKEATREKKSYAQELMDGFDVDEARKAVIYTEIFNRRY